MLDRRNKGGKSLVLRCVSAVKYRTDCPFYAKIRRSNKDTKWYICAGLEMHHNCDLSVKLPDESTIKAMMAERRRELNGNFGNSGP